jgi:SWI/SNF-related matrix-associated actin-dependent regulator 1 of chromatin subfamily A
MKKKVELTKNGLLKITFPFDWGTVTRVKTIRGRKYNEGKYWTAPPSVENLAALSAFEFTLSDDLIKKLEEGKKKFPAAVQKDISKLKGIDVPTLKKKLRPFQQKGVQFLQEANGRGILADDMGLGKTIQALAYMELNPADKRTIVVCTSSTKENWKAEAQSTLSKERKILILNGRKPSAIPTDTEVVILNFDLAHFWIKELLKYKANLLIIDECHKIKNATAARTKAVLKLGRDIPKIIPMSGTVIQNRPMEVYNAIQLVDPMLFPNRFEFGKKYCGGHHNGFGWTFNGASNMEELYSVLSGSIMIRRTKKEVLTELPDKTHHVVPFPLTNRKEYTAIENDVIGYLNGIGKKEAAVNAGAAEHLVQLNYLRQAAALGKMDAVLNWVDDFLESTDEKIVLFAVHKLAITKLREKYKDICVVIDGGTPTDKRLAIQNEFQESTTKRIFIGNIAAAGEGLTLTAAFKVAIIELPWTPGALQQAIDRVHRMTQKNAVEVFYLLAQDSIDMDLFSLLAEKQKVVDAVLDGKDVNEEINIFNKLITKLQAAD